MHDHDQARRGTSFDVDEPVEVEGDVIHGEIDERSDNGPGDSSSMIMHTLYHPPMYA